jgi:hypothetical protein
MKTNPAQSNHHRWWKRTIIIGVKSIDELGLRGKIAIIGIAKGSKSFYPGDSIRCI